ncbi:uncharacterized protein [Littorina saxatilis]|uniref:Profilin n=1 Tax=Littorina saxatilis TaxID=31220 RepID=A0AAN9ATS7_9CAEN
MSWDAYVGNMEGEGCMYAAFFDHEGNKWAETKCPILKITPDQVQHLVKGIRPPNSVDLRAQGAKLGDRKFLVIVLTENTAVLKQLGGDSNDKIMACAGLFKSGICIGASPAGEREKAARISVEKYADYLRGMDY